MSPPATQPPQYREPPGYRPPQTACISASKALPSTAAAGPSWTKQACGTQERTQQGHCARMPIFTVNNVAVKSPAAPPTRQHAPHSSTPAHCATGYSRGSATVSSLAGTKAREAFRVSAPRRRFPAAGSCGPYLAPCLESRAISTASLNSSSGSAPRTTRSLTRK